MSAAKHKKDTFYMIWNTESQSLDSVDSFFDIEEAIEVCEQRNHSIQEVEYIEEGNVEYVDDLPDVFEVRRVTAEKI